MTAISAQGPTVQSLFDKIDSNGDGDVTRSETVSALKKAGINGFFGIEANMAADAFMDAADTDGNGKVAIAELETQLKGALAGSAEGRPVTELAEEWFGGADSSGDGKLTRGELEDDLEGRLSDAGQSMAGKKAEIGAKAAIYLIDTDGDGKASLDEVMSLAEDIESRREDATAPVLWA